MLQAFNPNIPITTFMCSYSFNGMEKDDEIKGSGNSLDFGARMFDTRVGRFLSIDPLYHANPGYSPYSFAACNPLYNIDEDGKLPVGFIYELLKYGLPLVAMVSDKVVYAGIEGDLFWGVMGVSGGGELNFGVAADPKANYAITSTYGTFMNLLGYGGSFPQSDVGPENGGSWMIALQIGAGLEGGSYDLNNVLELAGSIPSLQFNAGEGIGVDLELPLDPESHDPIGGLVSGGIQIGAGFGTLWNETSLFAFTKKDLDSWQGAGERAFFDYMKESFANEDYQDIEMKFNIDISENKMHLYHSVVGIDDQGNESVLHRHTVFQAKKHDDNAWKTPGVKE